MLIDYGLEVYEGPEQDRRIVGFLLLDRSFMAVGMALSLVRFSGARLRQWSGDRWRDVNVIPNKFGGHAFDL